MWVPGEKCESPGLPHSVRPGTERIPFYLSYEYRRRSEDDDLSLSFLRRPSPQITSGRTVSPTNPYRAAPIIQIDERHADAPECDCSLWRAGNSDADRTGCHHSRKGSDA